MIVTLPTADLAAMLRAARQRMDIRQRHLAEAAEAQCRRQEEQAISDLRAYFGQCFGDLAEQLGIIFTFGIFPGYTGPAGVVQVDTHLRLITLQDGRWYLGVEGDTTQKKVIDHGHSPDEVDLTYRRDTLIIALAEQLGVEQ
ncbi:hypothetical protein K2Z83_20340 [Oscillochloris sp. ZM17-4]|uniref:hypothetical protein n=1 Tax=Oscillochloris sp. ZM17-4 TaxID=2866714 RepID=UPI001C72DF25|nr:hypothetical protein [Oscillochloris sp. ZM17-4]MBX0330021.1 hypothetical protein [Oscillochloris sp. ZM17-4]